MAQFGIHMCWYCCYVWSIHRSYMEFLDLAWSKLVLAFTSFNTKFTFSDMPDLLAPELQPPLPYHYFSESDSSNPEKGMIKYLKGLCFEKDYVNLLPGDHQACSVPRSRRTRSLKALRSCSLTLAGWTTGTESPWTLGTPAIVLSKYIFTWLWTSKENHLKLCLICDQVFRNLRCSHVGPHQLLIVGAHDLQSDNLPSRLDWLDPFDNVDIHLLS